MTLAADYIVIGAGSAGCVVAAELIRRQVGRVIVLEAGPSDQHPLVKMPFGLVWLMGSKTRDWRFSSTQQAGLEGRQLKIPRGRMLGGSGSINSMVWFRGTRRDFNDWGCTEWDWSSVEPAFQAVEEKLRPQQLSGAHPVTQKLSAMFSGNSGAAPTPEYESAGVYNFNLHNGRRWSAADAFLRPALGSGNLQIITGVEVDRIDIETHRARRVILVDGTEISAHKGIILSAGSIGSPSILMRSGIGDRSDLSAIGIDVKHDLPQVGRNLHDHPSVGLYFAGPNSGYGLTLGQSLAWAAAPFRYAITGKGRLASPTVEGGAFFNARGTDAVPDVQSHFIPFKLGWTGQRYTYGAGYFADVCLCRPKSRGELRLLSADPRVAPAVDLGILQDPSDLDTLVAGLFRLRKLLAQTDFGSYRAAEVFPAETAQSDDAMRRYVIERCATAYHPVGTAAIGAVVSPSLNVMGIENLWVADASVMPQVTSANTNAPSMMIGWKAATFITQEAA
jgi:choline dehydrogenase